MKKTIAALLVFILSAVVITGCKKTQDKKVEAKKSPGSIELTDLNGKKNTLKILTNGKPVMISFFASWCAICIKEVEENNKIYQKYKNSGLLVYGINVGEDKKSAMQFIKKYKVEYPVFVDKDETAAKSVGMIGLPLNIIYDGDFEEVFRDAVPPTDDLLKRITGAKK